MLTSPHARIVLGVFTVLAVVHLLAQLADAAEIANVTQWLLMPVLALVLMVGTRGTRRSRLVRLTLVALGFSWLGDTVPDAFDGDTSFLVLVGCFLVAQVVYIAAFWPYRDGSVLRRDRGWLVPYVLVVAALVVACAPHADSLLVPILVYGFVLGAMAVLSSGLNRLAWVGGALFLVSDGLIALDAFPPWWDLPQQGFWVMLTYILAQVLLVLGVLRESAADAITPAEQATSAP